jgi:putative tricarboxylic transport membrane protein
LISKQQRNAGMVFMAIGAYVIYYTLTELKIGTIHSPGSGFFTFICGIGIFLLSAALVVSSWLRGTEDRPLWEKGMWMKPMLAFGLTVVYAILIPRAGFILATILFLAGWQMIVEREKPVKTAIIALSGTAAMWVIFEKLLRVPLPNGLLPW